jgi:hypothetical protein
LRPRRSRSTDTGNLPRGVTRHSYQRETAREQQTGHNDKDNGKIAYPTLAPKKSRYIPTKLPYHDDLRYNFSGKIGLFISTTLLA